MDRHPTLLASLVTTAALLASSTIVPPNSLACDRPGSAGPWRVYPSPWSTATMVRTPAVTVRVSTNAAPELNKARTHVDLAKRAFRSRDLDAALQQLNLTIELLPEDADARQFRALVFFAQANYQQAAAEAYDAMLIGNAWTWSTLWSLYGDQAVYTAELRKLEAAAKADAKSLECHFLLAYHYLILGHLQAGEQELTKVLEIQPEEPLAQQLLQVVKQERAKQPAP